MPVDEHRMPVVAVTSDIWNIVVAIDHPDPTADCLDDVKEDRVINVFRLVANFAGEIHWKGSDALSQPPPRITCSHSPLCAVFRGLFPLYSSNHGTPTRLSPQRVEPMTDETAITRVSSLDRPALAWRASPLPRLHLSPKEIQPWPSRTC